jgi:hypothetical protein
VRVVEAPEQTTPLLAVGVGSALTVTVPLAVAEHPDALVAVTVYVVVDAGETVIDAVVAAVLHTNVHPAAVAVKVALLPAQILILLTVGVGLAELVTVEFADAVHPNELVPVTVYIPAELTEIVAVVAPVLQT